MSMDVQLFKKCIISDAKINNSLFSKLMFYAAKIGADLFQEIPEKIDEYDKIMIISPMMAIREDCPDLFSIVPNGKIGVLNEKNFNHEKNYSLNIVILCKEHFEGFISSPLIFLEKNKEKIFELSYKFNRLPCMDSVSGESRLSAYIINYNDVDDATINDDLSNWLPPYEYRQNIALVTDGCGIGDLVCVEPLARFCRDYLFKDENLIIISDYPELYEHLGLPIYGNKEYVPNARAYRRLTCFAPENDGSIHSQVLSHPQMNSTDYSSILAIKYQLSNDMKQISLSDNTHLLSDNLKSILSNSLIVHAGKHWASKTFPIDWWQSVVELLADNGINIVLIGKKINEGQGVVDVKCTRKNIISLVDKLTLRQTIGALKISPAVLTNDSMPIHISGAFDNWIFPILSCKKFEHVMPYRNGKQDYKVVALNKGYVFDYKTNRINQLDGFKIDACSEEKIREILPTPEEVLAVVKGKLYAEKLS